MCILVMIGVSSSGQQRLLAPQHARDESEKNWRAVLSGLKARGLERLPYIAVGERVANFSPALHKVYRGAVIGAGSRGERRA